MATRTTRDCLNEQNNFACASLLLVHFYATLGKKSSKCTIFRRAWNNYDERFSFLFVNLDVV